MSTLGEQVHAFRTAPERQWSTTDLAQRVGTSRQNIENLEAGTVLQPRYLAALAAVMETSVEALLGASPAPSVAAERAAPYRATTTEDALYALGAAIAACDSQRLHALSVNLAQWALEGGPDHYIPALLALLATPHRKVLAVRS